MADYTITGVGTLPDDTTPLHGVWTVRLANGVTVDPDASYRTDINRAETVDGVATMVLPETLPGQLYEARFSTNNDRIHLGPYLFDLTADRTWGSIIEVPSVPPLTPSLVLQAQQAAIDAATAKTGAETAETSAESAATAAASSATAAASSEASVDADATTASNAATTATTKASEASTSAGNAASSATAAAGSATSAGNSATSASGSASTATTKASEAATSASNAATSATDAQNSADAAAASAQQAASGGVQSVNGVAPDTNGDVAVTPASIGAATAAQGAKADTAVQPARSITAGTGLTGGGDLSANRTLAVSYGTTAGTAAQGNDSRITGAAQKASNLSDLASASTARTNLGAAANTGGARELSAPLSATTGTSTGDLNAGSCFYTSGNLTGAVTIVIANVPPAPYTSTVTVEINQGATAYAVTWPTGTTWGGGPAPTQTANKWCLATLYTRDGGASWKGSAVVQS